MIVNAVVQSIRVVLGIDIGTVKVSWVVLNAQTGDEIERGIERHNGNPGDVISKLDKKLEEKYIILNVVVTGSMSDLLTEPAIKVPEQAAQEEAAKFLFPNLGSYNILRLGGSGFSLLIYNEGKFSYYQNDRCSMGTGIAIERLCQSRFGLTVQEACQEALEAKKWHKMATRCSVFLKSEITHFANQGYLRDEILLSYFNALTSSVCGLVERWGVSGKLFLVGGVCDNQPLTNRLVELSREIFSDVKILEEKNFFEAIGVAQIAFSLQRNKTPISLAKCLSAPKKEITSFAPLSLYLDRVTKHEAKEVDVSAFFGKQVVVGFDLGSTGSKIAIVDAEMRQVIYTSYTDTKGDPVEASQELIRNTPRQLLQNVIGLGFTGSGRNTVASVFQAIFPLLVGKITIKTEILAHAKGASHFDPDNGESISVIEIGGQDAKYTLVINGQVVDATMNLACAAGTGSFLGEQASLYKISDIQEFGRLALGAENPANLGQHCTVFIAELASKALQEGYSLPDIFAGFYYAIVYNYINRVMGKRTLGKKIFLQGTPANNPALACAFAAVMNRDVIVPPNPGAMGAIGIALLALEEITEAKIGEDQYFDLAKFLEAKVISRNEFQCQDKSCGNGCIVNKVVVEVDGQQHISLNGGMCPKYEKSKKVKLPQGAPNPFRERDELLRNILQSALEINTSRSTIAIPVGMGVVRFIPFFAHFFHELGLNVRLIWPDKNTMEKGGRLCSSPDMCAPIKVMHGLFDDVADYFFSPKIQNLPLVGSEEGSCTCPLAQAVPDMVEYAICDSHVVILKPVLDFSNGLGSWEIQKALTEVGRELKLDPYLIKLALQKAVEVQNQFQQELFNIGKKALRYAKDNNIPAVLVCGRLYVITNLILNSGIPQAIQESGAIALPVDCYPTGEETPILDIMYWGEGQKNLRAVLDVLKSDNVFPLWLSCYGCGPDSFLGHFFERLSRGYPHMPLETDGHSSIGYATRIEAFLDVCFKYLKRTQREALSPDVSHFQPVKIFRPPTILIIPSMGEEMNQFVAAVCRSMGIESVALPPLSQEDFMAGKRDCSGKECLPFILLWGSIKNHLLRRDGDSQTFFVPTTDGPCRFCMYHILIKQLLEDLVGKDGAKKVHFLSPTTSNSYSLGWGQTAQLKMWAAVVASDLLRDMLLYFRPIAKAPSDVEGIYTHYRDRFIHLLEQPSNIWNTWGLTELIQEAANMFSAVPVNLVKAKDIADVVVGGEIYVRQVGFANDHLIKKLESLGMRVRLAPNREWINYVGFCDDKSNRWKVLKETWSRRFFERKLYNACAKILGWPHDHSVENIVRAGMPYLGPIPQGEAILGIGSLVLMYARQEIKGGILVGPYGCMPTKVAEAQLNRTKVPFLPIYCDGEPINEKRLAAFAWQIGGRKSLML